MSDTKDVAGAVERLPEPKIPEPSGWIGLAWKPIAKVWQIDQSCPFDDRDECVRFTESHNRGDHIRLVRIEPDGDPTPTYRPRTLTEQADECAAAGEHSVARRLREQAAKEERGRCVLHEEIVRDGPSRWTCETHPAQPATPPAPVAETCPRCSAPVANRTDHCSADQPLGGPLLYDCKPAPVASELPPLTTASAGLPKVRSGLELLLHKVSVEPHISVGHYDLMLMEMKAELDAAQAPVAVGVTPELEMVLEFAASRHKDANTDTRVLWNPEYLVDVRKAIAAVRAQAGKAQAVPGQVEVIPIGLWQLEELLKYAELAEVALRTGFHPPDFLFDPADCSLRNCIDAVKEQRDRYLAAVGGGK